MARKNTVTVVDSKKATKRVAAPAIDMTLVGPTAKMKIEKIERSRQTVLTALSDMIETLVNTIGAKDKRTARVGQLVSSFNKNTNACVHSIVRESLKGDREAAKAKRIADRKAKIEAQMAKLQEAMNKLG